MRSLLIVFLLKLKVHIKMKVMSCMKSHNNVSHVMGLWLVKLHALLHTLASVFII